MGLWSILFGKGEPFPFATNPPSNHLIKALEAAGQEPLSDHTWRIVLASPHHSLVFEISLFEAARKFEVYERAGINHARSNAVVNLTAFLKGQLTDPQRLDCLAFFDREFTVGANRGKTSETAWNILALDAEIRDSKLCVTRSAHRLEYPIGRVSLDFKNILKNFGQ